MDNIGAVGTDRGPLIYTCIECQGGKQKKPHHFQDDVSHFGRPLLENDREPLWGIDPILRQDDSLSMHVCDPICLGRSCGSMDLFLSKPEKSQTDAFLNLSVALFHLSCSFVFACLYVRTHREVEGEESSRDGNSENCLQRLFTYEGLSPKSSIESWGSDI